MSVLLSTFARPSVITSSKSCINPLFISRTTIKKMAKDTKAPESKMPYSLFQKHLRDPVNSPSSNFAGKTVLVTGSNTGLGFEAALKLAKLRAKHLILGVRDLEKGENAKRSILSQLVTASGTELAFGNQRISVLKLDMCDYESIQTFVRTIGKENDNKPLDVAILNAGVFAVQYNTPSKYGWENDLQVNVLSTALLAMLLLSSGKLKSDGGVLEFVASRRMQAVKLTEPEKNSPNLLGSFNQERDKFDASRQYQASKLLLMAFFGALAAKSSMFTRGDPGPIITAVCPGFCQSGLSRGLQGVSADALRAILNTFVLRSTEEGARALVSGAVAERERHGKFWFDDELHDVALPDSMGDTERFLNQIWSEVLEALRRDTDFRLP